MMGVSTMSTLSVKEVRETCPNALLLMQMYLFKRDDLTLMLLKQCEDVGYNAIAVTVDSPISGMRREDNRYGFKLPIHLNLGNFENFKVLDGVSSKNGPGFVPYWFKHIKSDLSWDNVDWLCSKTKLPILVKGILVIKLV